MKRNEWERRTKENGDRMRLKGSEGNKKKLKGNKQQKRKMRRANKWRGRNMMISARRIKLKKIKTSRKGDDRRKR